MRRFVPDKADREWRFYLDDMIVFAEKGMIYRNLW